MTSAPPAPPRGIERPPLEGRDGSKGFALSLAFHLAFASFILIKTLIFPSAQIMILPSLRVDLVGLPDILKKDLANVSPAPPVEKPAAAKPAPPPAPPAFTPEKAKEIAKPDEMVLKPKNEAHREKNLKSSLDRIKALEQIDEEETPSKTAGSPVIKGNKISKGSSLTGDARETDQASYFDSIRSRLQNNWELPLWISRQNYSARVQLFIDRRGRVTTIRFIKPSGNAQFDDAVRKAITQSDPFAPPPAEIAGKIVSDGIQVGFPL